MRECRSRPRTRAIFHGAVAIAGLFSHLAVAAQVSPIIPEPFETRLRRTITIQGQEQARFELAARMAHYGVPGVSVAIIDDCRIVNARGFGTSAGSGVPIAPSTLFQAGSISKTVTAVAALRLVDQGALQLDSDVRPLLTSWAQKEGPAGSRSPITLRRLLNHTAGLNEIGGEGYSPSAPLPTLTQIINGTAPANTPPVFIETEPGKKWAYSSGGYYLIQALMTSATGGSFPRLAQRLVFSPAGMTRSSFAQPLDAAKSRLAAKAAGPDGSPMPGGWRVNPELAAGGLWTTPIDLAQLLIALTRDIRGERHRLLSPEGVRQMMKPGLGNWGLGVELGSKDGPRRIGHTGHNIGYASQYVMYPDTCQGAVVMTNGDEGGWLITEIFRAISDTYHWPEPHPSTVQAAAPLTEAIARKFVGTYQLRDFPTERFTITRKPDGGLYWARDGHVGRDLLPEQANRLFSPDSRMSIDATEQEDGRATILDVAFGGGRNIAKRID